jgi:hypothetical protein
MLKYLLFIFLISTIFSCTTETEEKVIQENIYFDMSTFFESEVERLKALPIRFKKRVIFNEQEELKIQDTIDIEKELALFSKYNINKPIYINQYEIDSVFGETQQLQAIIYNALDEKLITRQLKVEFDTRQQISAIYIHALSETNVIRAESKGTYRPYFGYFIHNKQKMVGIKEQHLNIQVEWLE